MVKNITNYIDYLREHHNLLVTVHDKSTLLAPHMNELASYNIHSNPYCLYIKSTKESWDKCRQKQNSVYQQCENGPFFGMCYAGVEEFVIPYMYEEKVGGFVSVSGYKKNSAAAKCRLSAAAHEYNLDSELLHSLYNDKLSADIPDMNFILTLIEPLCAMLTLLCENTAKMYPSKRYVSESNYIYGHILVYLRKNFSKKITLDELCKVCHCSKSYISHIFKKHSGCSISAYTNMIRLDEASILLKNTLLSVKEISDMVGFSDPNYFSNSFRKRFDISPKQFRKNEKKD